MVNLLLRHAHQIRRFSITEEEGEGWEILEETEGGVVRRVKYDDWHRVERAKTAFEVLADSLRRQGWIQA